MLTNNSLHDIYWLSHRGRTLVCDPIQPPLALSPFSPFLSLFFKCDLPGQVRAFKRPHVNKSAMGRRRHLDGLLTILVSKCNTDRVFEPFNLGAQVAQLGRALDRRSKCPRFDPGSGQLLVFYPPSINTYCKHQVEDVTRAVRHRPDKPPLPP